MSRPRPPRPLAWLAERLVPRLADEATLGDLDERYAHRLRTAGRGAANRWYARQLAAFATALPATSARAILAPAPAVMSGTLTDLRHEGRALLRQPRFALGVVIVLGLAVGASATAFSLLHGVLLQPLPFAAPDELVMLWDEYLPSEGAREPKPVSELQYRAWRERTGELAAAGAFDSIPAVIRAGEWPEQIDAALVTASLFPTLGVRPALGRLFTDEDDVRGAARVVILSHDLWQSRFGGDPGILGRSMPIDGESTTIVGVMPADFWFYDPYAATRSYTGASASAAQLWRPLAGSFSDDPDYPRYRVVARLRAGATIDTAAAAIAAAEQSLAGSLPAADGRVRVVPLTDQILTPVRPRLLGLAAAVALVLIVASVNLVSLFAARLDARRADLGVRAALGASRIRLVRASVLQGAIVGLAGGAAGALVATIVVPAVVALVPRGLPLAHRVGVDPIVAGFALAISVGVGIVVAALSAWRAGNDGWTSLTGGRSRGVAGSVARRRLARVTVTVQVALSLMLLIGAALLLRSLAATYAIDAGFDPSRTLAFRSLLMLAAPGAPPDRTFFDRLEARIAALPGVEAVGSASMLPFSRWGQSAAVRTRPDAEPERVDYRLVSPRYFDALRLRLRQGRLLTDDDRAGAPMVIVVNEAFVDRVLDGADPMAAPIAVSARGRDRMRAIVGVVGDVRDTRLHAPARPTVYAPIAQEPAFMRQFAVRSGREPAELMIAIRRAAAEIDPAQPLQEFITLDALVAQSMEEERFYAGVTAALAGLAALLAVAGLYGIVSLVARERDREVGIRIALGSTPSAVRRLLLVDGMRPVAVGLALGAVGAAGASRLLRSLLHGVPEIDPISYAAATAAFAVAAALACLVPARRAASVDPVRMLSRG